MKRREVETNVVLLSGGSGTRLWPLSNGARSKQFLKVLKGPRQVRESMVQRTVRLVRECVPNVSLTIATSTSQLDEMALQVEGVYEMSVEPERRDTAPAIMLACAHLAWEQGRDLNSPVVVMPIDTYANPDYYESVGKLSRCIQAGMADIVLLGVEPTCPSEKFGYIVPAQNEIKGPARPVACFREKPSEDDAIELIEAGALWNCGVFAFRLGWLLELASRYTSASTYTELRERYHELPCNSFDYEVVEQASSVAVVTYAGTWKDLGTWNTLCEELAEPTNGDVWLDSATCENVHVVNESGLPIVVAGVSDVVVVATPDGILVSGKEESARIKGLVGRATESRPMCGRKTWGEYRVISHRRFEDGRKMEVRELRVFPERQVLFRPQRHTDISVTVVAGTGQVVISGEVHDAAPGDVFQFDCGIESAVQAVSEMCVIEVIISSNS